MTLSTSVVFIEELNLFCQITLYYNLISNNPPICLVSGHTNNVSMKKYAKPFIEYVIEILIDR